MRRTTKSAFLWMLSVGLVPLGDASAGPIFEVQLNDNVFNNFQKVSGSVPPITGSFTRFFNHAVATATNVSSDRGALHNQLTLERLPSVFGANGRADQVSLFRLDDLNFFDESNPGATGTAPVQFGASFTVSATGGPNGGTIFDTFYELRIEVSWQSSPPNQPANPVVLFTSPPLVDGSSISDSVTSPVINVPLDQLVRLNVFARVDARLNQSFSNPDSISLLADTTVGLQNFTLPQGIGLKSDQLGVDSTAPVPEPSTLVLFGIGMVSLTGYRCRRKRKRLHEHAL